jgi:uncharacterized protein (DUF849 family)
VDDMKNRKVIINACLTGMVPTKELNVNTPILQGEIIDCALKCADLGASMIHLHARDENGKPTWRKEVYAEIIQGIRKVNKDLILIVSTSGRDWKEFEKRSECLELEGNAKPDMASLTLGSMNFISQESVNSPEMIERLALKMKEKKIKPEIEIFELGMIHKAKYLMQKGIINDNCPYLNILMGSLGTAPLDAVSLGAMMHLLPNNAIWGVAGIGAYQLDANILGIALGGGVRVGLEDNIYFDREKKILASNEMLVLRIAKIVTEMNLEIATSTEAREILKLNK